MSKKFVDNAKEWINYERGNIDGLKGYEKNI